MTRSKSQAQKEPATKASNKNQTSAKHEHRFSSALQADARVKAPPRFVGIVQEGEGVVYMAKIYATLDTPGSELMTISCVRKNELTEHEMRFDERYPISLTFRKQSDEERVATAKDLIQRTGGLVRLRDMFAELFAAK